ncbi:MAG TPA: MT-A70 family methyltransferase [Vicinamibacterales bacterium]|nr:MT-A70 family methyltransferase [Vicinamibacterales bacterium]
MTRYRTIVADPPWDHGDGTGLNLHHSDPIVTGLPYRTMSVDDIVALPVRDLSVPDTRPERLGSHLYLWTTTRYIEDAYKISRAWGFSPTALLVWCKPSRGFGLGGTFQSNVEFIVFGRRGAPTSKTTIPTRWFEWPRGAHSAKPDAFLDMVEQVSHPPYLELFARRARFGWDYWGDQSLGTAEVAA